MQTENTSVHPRSLLWSIKVGDSGKAENFSHLDFSTADIASGYHWVHMQSDMADSWETMTSMGLSDSICDAMCAMETRPRALHVDDGTLIYLRGINLNPDADPEDMVSLRIWFNENRVISARRKDRKLLSIHDTKTLVDEGKGPITTADFVLQLIDKVANRISEVVDALDDELTEFEAAGATQEDARLTLSLIRRKAAAVRRYLAPQRDALDTLYRFTNIFDQNQAFELRDLTDRMTRYVEDLDLAKERAMVLQDELRNRIAEQQGMRMYVLSLVTAIFLPLSFLTGVFGMNVAGLPGTENPGAFGYLATGMVGLAVAMFIAMLWKKWF